LDTTSATAVQVDATLATGQDSPSALSTMGVDLLNALSTIFPAMFNLTFVMVLICLGSYLGAYAKWSREPGELAQMPLRSVLFGIAASFLCVPFFSSVIHIEYASIMLPIELGKTPQFVQHALLLISISGIASYLGYAMLDGIADKVLRKEIEEETEERKKQDEQIFRQQKQLRAKMLYLEAVTTVESAEKTKSENLLKDALKAIEEAVAIYSEDKSSKEYYQSSVHKAFILKRLNRVQEALQIVNDQLDAGWKNPITLYNKACYLYLLLRNKQDSTDAIKELIRMAITLPTDNENHRKKQEVLRDRVSADEEPDIEGLFDEHERAAIAILGKQI
jgi:tetratricopeptide (TPR) repeat protein